MKSKFSTTKDPDLARWCAALATSQDPDKVPPGWLTAKQICKQVGKALSTVGGQLNRAVKEGAAERTTFRILTGSVVRPVPHYRLR